MTNLLAALARHADTIPDQLFTRILKGGKELATLNFAQTWALAGQWAAVFTDHGLSPGDPVVLALPNTADFVGAFYGGLMGGCMPAPLAPPRRTADDDAYWNEVLARARFIGARVVVAAQEHESAPVTEGITVVTASRLDPARVSGPARLTPHDPALIQFTSGTAGRPKAVLLSHAALHYQAQTLRDWLGLHDRFVESGVSWLPLFHDMGLVGFLLTPGFAGGEINLMQPEDFVLRPSLWLKALTEYKATITGGPPSAYALCARRVREADVSQYDLASVRVALVGAEQVTRESLSSFVEKLRPAGFREQVLMPTYGLAENCLAATMPALETGPRFDAVDAAPLAEGRAVPTRGDHPASQRLFANVGLPLPGVRIRIHDDAGRPLPNRCIGEIALQSPSLMSGFIDSAQASADDGPGAQDEWLHTGDLGYLADGCLHVTGRKKEIVIVGGRNYYPDDVEQLVGAVDGVRMDRAVAVGVPDVERATEQLVVLAETDRAAPGERDLLRLAIRRALLEAGYPIGDVILLKPKSIQSTLTGKLKRLDCRERLLAGEFAATP